MPSILIAMGVLDPAPLSEVVLEVPGSAVVVFPPCPPSSTIPSIQSKTSVTLAQTSG